MKKKMTNKLTEVYILNDFDQGNKFDRICKERLVIKRVKHDYDHLRVHNGEFYHLVKIVAREKTLNDICIEAVSNNVDLLMVYA